MEADFLLDISVVNRLRTCKQAVFILKVTLPQSQAWSGHQSKTNSIVSEMCCVSVIIGYDSWINETITEMSYNSVTAGSWIFNICLALTFSIKINVTTKRFFVAESLDIKDCKARHQIKSSFSETPSTPFSLSSESGMTSMS